MLVLAQKELRSLWVFGFPFLCGLTVTEVQFVILLSLYLKLWMRFASEDKLMEEEKKCCQVPVTGSSRNELKVPKPF